MLSGIIRESISKADTKALRKNGYLIANIYGKGKENLHCAFKRNDFIREVKKKTDLIFEVEVGSQKYPVVIQEYQKDPITSEIIHVDLMLAQKGIEAKYSVKVRTIGTPKGLKNKGVLMMSKKRIKVKAAPENLPKDYEINVSDLDVGDVVLVRDLPAFNGVKIVERDDVAIVGVIKSR
ncbi:50S ribosomal protein L25/general stress protein Ctc [Helicobacter winghamensis]|uniref:Large ribosomal subunit protein bL25 n=1 Tax=Helicobacter winghamensis TaxID=157268 RepID=A0A2N3PKQ9_9HELI|nr:50S ribosomal protein L25/general stress protein Ctc [Helicobacter winghamensis]EEO26043.1 ribosomal protein L25, Ctc-form [Helicobacter winghamensis ATCC BAA-430]PKT78835.1 50S ribosomal protein L25/general stress protein Ctc [Helicobacter winghamensis]PKT78866.1 50S ribosomal protein L25/general stress protein Ctc [Helicobacter winghamensis]PKT78974.1 50S ribosomal protein L25/general stress protein Ctc [Helicobacter winghamensis]PKT82194.1 50S ribosomal protein L25/general stress protein